MLTAAAYIDGVRAGHRATLARAITLIESQAPRHRDLAHAVLTALLPHAGQSLRLGLTGVPGVGKSTFIEQFGLRLCDDGHRVAVLAIDPSSPLHRGSILGDKTRMNRLSQHPNAYIRPSPAGKTLGGVAHTTRETVLLCEAAGFDMVLVETVGVGQSEGLVRGLVDFFLLLLLPGGGDELQGLKKGVMELADALFINKADGESRTTARLTQAEYQQALHYQTSATPGWTPKALIGSALTGDGLDELRGLLQNFVTTTKTSGAFQNRRQQQQRDWFHQQIQAQLLRHFADHPAVRAQQPAIEQAVLSGECLAPLAAQQLLTHYQQALSDGVANASEFPKPDAH